MPKGGFQRPALGHGAVEVWRAGLHQTHRRPSVQECRLRLKRPKSVFFNSFISSNLWKCDLEITQLYRTFLATPGPELS
jgi:hypothetical protein